jgi:hypothetical protein
MTVSGIAITNLFYSTAEWFRYSPTTSHSPLAPIPDLSASPTLDKLIVSPNISPPPGHLITHSHILTVLITT